jgi:hypothetical protein
MVLLLMPLLMLPLLIVFGFIELDAVAGVLAPGFIPLSLMLPLDMEEGDVEVGDMELLPIEPAVCAKAPAEQARPRTRVMPKTMRDIDKNSV